jgi:hypothetical protein
MMKAEMASETRRSRAHTATTGSGCAPDSGAPDSPTGAGFGGGLATSGIVFIFYTQAERGRTGQTLPSSSIPRTNKLLL